MPIEGAEAAEESGRIPFVLVFINKINVKIIKLRVAYYSAFKSMLKILFEELVIVN
jgi:hypothetical protein